MAAYNVVHNVPLPYPFNGENDTHIPSLHAPSVLGDRREGLDDDIDVRQGELRDLLGHSGELAAAEVIARMENLFTHAFGNTILDKLPGTIYTEVIKGDEGAEPPCLSIRGPDYRLPHFQDYEARWIEITTVRERWGRVRYPFIHTVHNEEKLTLGGSVFERSWYGNGIITEILLVTPSYVVFNEDAQGNAAGDEPMGKGGA
ncbi:uncharacterized protein EV420DRAFT_1484478 [Desarmillaria tabescens]|uniref:Uncharacterized protein n=1 Tax=Armillaria tabescens TaxID=1929756 RepID=A0AA39MSX1_ARMTA|nr:uncharacterized protein EV420DRAFT_1484478 [Desarmillaria tabescens]KAK0445053.1 hypothetical protein EV420DRAFT_1484478 [Desarmillaria tabescens]